MPFRGIIMYIAQKSNERPTVYVKYSDLILQYLVQRVTVMLYALRGKVALFIHTS